MSEQFEKEKKYIKNNELKKIERFLVRIASPEAKKILINFTAKYGSYEAFLLFLKHRTQLHQSHFYNAAKYNNIDVLKNLINNPRINIYDQNHKALSRVIINNHIECTKIILSKYRSIKDIIYSQAFEEAAVYGRLEIAKYIVDTYNINPADSIDDTIISLYHEIKHSSFDDSQALYSAQDLINVFDYIWNFKEVREKIKVEYNGIYNEISKKYISHKVEAF